MTPEMLQDRKDSVKKMANSVHQPIDIIFNALDDLANFAELSKAYQNLVKNLKPKSLAHPLLVSSTTKTERRNVVFVPTISG